LNYYDVPTREGYNFRGYKVSGDENLYTDEYYEEYPEGIIYICDYVVGNAVTFTAVWEKQIEVKFVTDKGNLGEEGVTEKTYYYEKDEYIHTYYRYPSDMTKAVSGYKFAGWRVEGDVILWSENYKNLSENIDFISDYKVTEDVTFIAVWEESCEVTFESAEGYINGDKDTTESNPYIVIKGDELFYRDIPNIGGREGYVVKGYKIKGDESDTLYVARYSPLAVNEKSIYKYEVDSDVTFVVVWAESCDVTFISDKGYLGNDNEDATEEVIVVEKGGYLEEFPNVYDEDVDGYKFLGYSREGDDNVYVVNRSPKTVNEKRLADLVISDDTTFTAIWVSSCTLTFKSTEGYIYGDAENTQSVYEVIKDRSIDGNDVYTPNISGRENYTTKGWKIENDNSNVVYVENKNDIPSGCKYIGDYVVTEDTVFTAVWVSAYNITFNCEMGGIEYDEDRTTLTIQVEEGEAI